MNVKSEYLEKLNTEQNKRINQCIEHIKQWTKFHEDYTELEKRLETLADKLDYDVMVPFGSVGFMPGKLVHTNEIMVLLGENWFVERSAKQACGIVKRRIEQCDNTLQKLQQEKQHLENWKTHTSDVQKEVGGDLVEIMEECDEEQEKLWRERHKVNVRNYYQKRAAGENSQEVEGSSSEEDLLEDHRDSELSDSGHNHHEGGNRESEPQRNKHQVRWKEDTIDKNRSLHVSFTEARNVASSSEGASTAPLIRSPADIYKHFTMTCQPEAPKSILKCSQTKQPTAPLPVQSSTTNVTTKKTKNEAFSGMVLERSDATHEVATETEPGRRISKFKSQQQAKRISKT